MILGRRFFRPIHNVWQINNSLQKTTTSVVGLSKEEKQTFGSSGLRQKIELAGIRYHSYSPGDYTYLTCPKCKGGLSMERSLSFYINQNEDFAMWRCFRFECGWAGQVSAVIKERDQEEYRTLTEDTLGLEPLGDELIQYFAERKISMEVLQKNAVMQTSDDKKAIAFTYRRHGMLINCKYRSTTGKRFWQEKGAERILYGLDGLKGADEIIIVEGEIDKLSMDQAGIFNCVSVPDGAPQKVSSKALPSPKEATRIILATDGDTPGRVLAKELARRLGKERCWIVTWPKNEELGYFKDANEVLKNLGPGVLRDIVNNAKLYQPHD